MDSQLVKRNIRASLALQIVTMICSFIVPQVKLLYFGSEINGLLNSISQFLNVIAFVEGGVSSVVTSNLFSPLKDKDDEKLSRVIAASNKFFRQLSIIFVIYAAIVGIVYPLLKAAPVSKEYVAALIWVTAFTTFVQYAYSLSYRLLLTAGQKVYIVCWIQIIFNILNTIAIVVLAVTTKNVLLACIGSSVVFLVQPILFHYFVKKYFKIDSKAKPDKKALSQRWDGFGQNVAYYIHSNTDVILLTIFSTFLEISVYTVHASIITAVRGVTVSISSAFSPTMGSILHKDSQEEAVKTFRMYTFMMWFVTSIIFCTTIIMIEPFIAIYTRNITDVNYYRYIFAVLLTCAEAVYCIRDPYISAIYTSGHFKQTMGSAYLEAIINIVVSLALIKPLGLTGIALGTLLGMAYRMVYSAIYVEKYLIKNTISVFAKTSISFLFLAIMSVAVGKFVQQFQILSYWQWILASGVVVLFVALVVLLLAIVLFKNIALGTVQTLWRGKRRT